ncbi:MAG: NADPH-dependent oxidoreductase [Bacteroides sp.]|nr:NADPH-dependent oxidoreductase [Bacteroides sp.]
MIKDYFSTRRSVRHYKDEEVPTSKIVDIVEKAMRAPTCGNMQLYSVIMTKDKKMKQQLEPLHFNQPASTGCSVILTICADFNRFTRWCELSSAKPGYDNFHSFIVALTDAIIFAQQIVTIAEMEGLGTCYLGTVNYNAAAIAELLNLPTLVVPVASISLGYPVGDEEQCERLPVEAIFHEEAYRIDSDEKLLTLFKVKDDFLLNKEFVKENNKDTLAQVFTDIRYPENVNKEVSESFIQTLKDKGFYPK